jgi:hypothetical protein
MNKFLTKTEYRSYLIECKETLSEGEGSVQLTSCFVKKYVMVAILNKADLNYLG